MELKIGSVVRAKAGRDKDSFFVGFIYICFVYTILQSISVKPRDLRNSFAFLKCPFPKNPP